MAAPLLLSVLIALSLHSLAARARGATPELRYAAVIFACSRPSHLRKTLRSFAQQDPASLQKVALYISIDAHRRAKHVQRAAEGEAASLGLALSGVWRQPAPLDAALDTRARIARHYYLGLRALFAGAHPPSHAIVLEDDLDLAPDFLAFALGAAARTSADAGAGPAAVSGWNDNGGAGGTAPAAGATALTDFFPGLGWVLPRYVWAELEPLWPHRGAAAPPPPGPGPSGGSARRKFPPARAAPAGWDWWVRAEFSARGWYALHPLLPRVAHRGAAGANVAAGEQQARFVRLRVARARDALSPAGWERALSAAQVTRAGFTDWQRGHEARALRVESVDAVAADAGRDGPQTYLLPFAEHAFPALAQRLALWPHPRGFFNGRLMLPLADGAWLMLVRETESEEHKRDFRRRGFLAGVNESCAHACGAGGDQECSVEGISGLNSCAAMAEAFGCASGCVFETGSDIPAIVEQDAPLSTRGACVVTENAAGIGCGGRFQHTRRGCVCGGTAGRGRYMGGSRRYGPPGAGAGGHDLNGRKTSKEEL